MQRAPTLRALLSSPVTRNRVAILSSLWVIRSPAATLNSQQPIHSSRLDIPNSRWLSPDLTPTLSHRLRQHPEDLTAETRQTICLSKFKKSRLCGIRRVFLFPGDDAMSIISGY